MTTGEAEVLRHLVMATDPHAPEHPETVRSCLGTILEEEWEHHRYAVRDLDALALDRRSSAGLFGRRPCRACR